VARAVVLIGLTSLFTDISAEMVATVLPFYLVFTLGLTPLQFGLLDGLYQGAGAIVRIASGFTGDRLRRHKEVAVVGYALSAVSKLGFLAAGTFGGLAALIALDRTGKGIRTAPRDALISLTSTQEQLGTSFGVHRALDTTGALLGPLIAFGLLALAPGRFDAVFVVSFCAALIGLSILTLFVRNPRRPPEDPQETPVSLRAAFGLLSGKRFRTLTIVAAVLGLATMSDGFVYLGLQRRLDFEPRYLPLLYVGTALVYMLLAIPFGRLADRWGRTRVFLCGYGSLLGVYGVLLLPAAGAAGPAAVVLSLVLLGTYYAATDGVLMALAGALLPPALRGSGLALLVTGTSTARLLASVLFGATWTAFGFGTAVLSFAVALTSAVAIAALATTRIRAEAAHA